MQTYNSINDERFLDPRLLRLDFDQYQRYRCSSEIIQSLLLKDPAAPPITLLEVGSNVLDLFPIFLGNTCKKVIRCDVVDVEGFDPRFVKLSEGQPMPFAADSFDVIAALDVLEHMYPKDRMGFIRDCVRVARDLVVLTFPCGGPEVAEAESILRMYLQESFGGVSPFLEEHIQFGLPTPDELSSLLTEIGLPWRGRKNSPLPNWLALNLFSNTFAGKPDYGLKPLSLFNEFYNRSFYRKDFAGAGYRVVYVIAKRPGLFDNSTERWGRNFARPGESEQSLERRAFEIMVQIAVEYHQDIQTQLAPLLEKMAIASLGGDEGHRDIVAQLAHYEKKTAGLKAQIEIDAKAHTAESGTGLNAANPEALATASEDPARRYAEFQVAQRTLEGLRKLSENIEKKNAEVQAAKERLEHLSVLEAAVSKNRQELNEARKVLQVVNSSFIALFFGIRAEPSGNVPSRLSKLIEKTHHGVALSVTSSEGVVQVEQGHSIWCFHTAKATLSWHGDLAPGRYYFKTRAMASQPAQLLLKIPGEATQSIGLLSQQPADYSLKVDLAQHVNEFSLTLDRATPYAAIGDFHVVREDNEVVLDALKRNSIRLARKYSLIPSPRPEPAPAPVEPIKYSPSTSRGLASYSTFMETRLRERSTQYPATDTTGLLSLLTCAWNTSPHYLDVLTHSVLNQRDCSNFEWVVLDNGSTAPQTVAYLNELRNCKNVKYFRVEQNLGIIGGMRFCLEHATGRYILPLDSDDFLYPDCLKIMAYYARKENFPALLYSDEDMLSGEDFHTAYLKPDWDPVLFLNSCYIAHLCAIDRKLALEYGAYVDPDAQGCHDWDTFIRFMVKGHAPVHVPEVVYSWRNHPASTASNITSKSYIAGSHRHVLGQFLKTRAHPERYRIEASPLFNGTPDWWFRRTYDSPRPLLTVILSLSPAAVEIPRVIDTDYPTHHVKVISLSSGLEELQQLAQSQADRKGLVHLMFEDVRIAGDEWPWEALTLMELYPDVVMIGGRVLDRARTVLAAGEYFGVCGDCACPDIGRSANDSGYFSQMWKQRSVDAASSMLAIVDAAFLAELLKTEGRPRMSLPFLGAWAGAYAAQIGKRVVYTPHLTGRCVRDIDWRSLVGFSERASFVEANSALLSHTRYLGRLVSRDMAQPYVPQGESERETLLQQPLQEISPRPVFSAPAHTQTPYTRWLERRIRARAPGAEVKVNPGQFTILTTVYNTPPEYLDEAAESLFTQACPDFEWVLLDNGSTKPDVIRAVRRLGKDSRVKYSRVDENLGIMGGMRLCLKKATGEYIVPMDADDILTPDALQILARNIARNGAPDFLYSDEDMLVDGIPQLEYLRPDWDPVLNVCTSYIFHLCAFKRTRALALELYSDMNSTWCHDWDTVFRFAAAGVEPFHVPEVLYHWRMHTQSSTARPNPEKGSMVSQKHLLLKFIGRQPSPELYKVELFPISRGVPEWWIRRLPKKPEPMQVVVFTDNAASGLESALRMTAAATYPFSRVLFVGLEKPLAVPSNWRADRDRLEKELARLHQEAKTGTRAVQIEIAEGAGIAGLQLAAALPGEGLTLVYSSHVAPAGGEWPWEALALYRMHADVVLFSGRILSRERTVIAGGEILGFNGLVGSPEKGRMDIDPGYKAMALKQRCVSAVNSGFFLADSAFLRRALKTLPQSATLPFLGAWLGAIAAGEKSKAVFTPLISAVADETFTGDAQPSARERDDFLARHSSVVPDHRWYSRHFRRDPSSFYAIDYAAEP